MTRQGTTPLLEAIRHGERRRRLLAGADAELDAIAELIDRHDLPLARVERVTEIPRTTLRRALERRRARATRKDPQK